MPTNKKLKAFSGQDLLLGDSFVVPAAGTPEFGGDLVVQGNLTVNGTLAQVNTTDLEVEDKLITLNKGGIANSGASSGVEIEEDSAITAYFRVTSSRNGWEVKAPNSANVITLPNNVGAADVVLTAGTQTIGGSKTFSSTISGSISGNAATVTNGAYVNANNVFTGVNEFRNSGGTEFRQTSTGDGVEILGRNGGSSSHLATITPETLTASRTVSLPNISGTVILDAGTQTIGGSKTFSAPLTISHGTTDSFIINDTSATGNPRMRFRQNGSDRGYIQYVDSGDRMRLARDGTYYMDILADRIECQNISQLALEETGNGGHFGTIQMAALSASYTFTIPNVGTSQFVMTEGTQTIDGFKTFIDPVTVNVGGEALRIEDPSATGSPFIRFAQAATNRAFIQYDHSTASLRLASIATSPNPIFSLGSTTTLNRPFEVQGRITADHAGDEMIRMADTSTTGSPYISWYQTTTERARIQFRDSTADLLIQNQQVPGVLKIGTSDGILPGLGSGTMVYETNSTANFARVAAFFMPNLPTNQHAAVMIGRADSNRECGEIVWYRHPSTATLSEFRFGYQGNSSLLSLRGDDLVRINGTLSKASGTFQIKHPIVPDKFLFHSFIEGPSCDNIYRGTVVLENGRATVNIDTVSKMTQGTFRALNRNIQVFTSNETGWSHVKGRVDENILTIECEDISSSDQVSWMVVGQRQDDEIKASVVTDEDGYLIPESGG